MFTVLTDCQLQHIEPETKWPPFSRQHFKNALFHKSIFFIFDDDFPEFCPWESINNKQTLIWIDDEDAGSHFMRQCLPNFLDGYIQRFNQIMILEIRVCIERWHMYTLCYWIVFAIIIFHNPWRHGINIPLLEYVRIPIRFAAIKLMHFVHKSRIWRHMKIHFLHRIHLNASVFTNCAIWTRQIRATFP